MNAAILGCFLLLLGSIAGWWLTWRRIGNDNPATHPLYRRYQALTAAVATLLILLALLIVFSSDPGDPEDYLWWP